MAEQINNDYEVSAHGTERHWPVPYSRLTDATPTPSNPAMLLGRVVGTQLCGTILTIDAGRSRAIVDFTPGRIYRQDVRNVLTYNAGAENTFGALNIGDAVYYDRSATMPAGVYLSTSPLDSTGAANALFGYVVQASDVDSFPKGGATASTQECAVIQRGAGA